MFNPIIILRIIILCLVSAIASGILVYRYTDKTYEVQKLKESNAQKDAIILTDKKQTDASNYIINSLNNKLESSNYNYEAIQYNLQNVQVKLRNTNRINLMLLRIIQDGEQTDSLSTISNSTTAINAKTDTTKFIDAVRVTSAIINDLHQCNDTFIRYNELINWVESQEIIYNKEI